MAPSTTTPALTLADLPEAVLQAIENGVLQVVLVAPHEGRPLLRVEPVGRCSVRLPDKPRDGKGFGLAKPIKLRGGGSILDVLDKQRR